MSNTLESVHLLEVTLQKLLSNYDFLVKENQILLETNSNLQQLLLNKEELIANQKKEFDMLKIAKTIEGSSKDSKDTKLKINSLIREIDKCIFQLQE